MPTRILAVAALLLTLPPAAAASEAAVGAAAAPVPSDWSVIVGGGMLTVPSYPGASSNRLMALPYVEVKYRQQFFLSPSAGIGVNAIATRRLQGGIAVLPDFGRSASSSDRLRGWGDLGGGASVKMFGRYSFGPFSLLADVRRQLGAGDGTLVAAGTTSMIPLGRRVTLIPTLKLTWANARHARAYFGINESQSAAALAHGVVLPMYSAGAGLRDAGLSLLGVVRLDERWAVQPVVRAEVLLGDAAASPLVTRRFQATAGALVAYRL